MSLLRLMAGITLMLGLANTALAGRADQNKPMNIEADSLRYEDGNKVSVFSGNVSLSKGSIVMRGARMEVRQDQAGNQFGKLDGSAGKPAFFRQKRDGAGDEYIEAQAASVTYDSKNATVKLVGAASLKRLQGSTVLDTISGNTITYNSNTDIFTVNGGGEQSMGGSNVTNVGGRVRVTLTSRAGAAADEAASKAPPSNLKPSLQLQSDKP